MTAAPLLLRDDFPGADAPVFVTRHARDRHRPSRASVTHRFAALAFYTGGRARIEQHGRFAVHEGDVLLVPAGQPHRFVERQDPELWGLGFSVPCLGPSAAGLLAPFERVRVGGSPVVRIATARRPFLQRLFEELAEATDAQRLQPAVVQQSLLTLILNEVARAGRNLALPAAPVGVVAASLQFIERNCIGPLTLNDVATAVGRSAAYVTTALSRATGRSAVQWIIDGRMAEARRLLLHSEARVDLVAERIGYADATHFIRLFRRHHGATPAAWRLRHRSG